MARSESQGVQIALIVSLVFLFLFIALTYWFFRKYNEAFLMSQKDKEEHSKISATLRDATGELEELKAKAGFGTTMTKDDWSKAATEDLKKHAPTLPAEQQTYRAALEQLSNALREASTNLAATLADLQAQQLINEQREAAKESQIAEHKAKLDEAAKTYAQEQSTFMSDRQRIEQEKDAQVALVEKTKAEYTAKIDELTKKVAQLEGQLSLTRAQLTQQHETIAQLQGDVQALPDGTIRRVNQRGTVWIDVGERDYLPRQMAFSVYGIDQNGVARDKRKGAIEVTRILDDHLAEAKILEDDILDPIVKGDLIYTPLWEPGRQTRFALAGFMDLDGDDLSDRPIVRDMITMSGAVIDAELGDDGKMQGTMSMDTRYLIVGDKEREGDPALGKVGQLEKTAKELGVEIITLANFLERTGWKDTKHVLRPGVSDPLDFKGPRVDNVAPRSTGVVSGVFEKRRSRGQIKSTYGEKPAAKPQPPATAAPRAAPKAPAEKKPADEAPADDAPADDMPSDEAPAAEEPAGEAPAADEPAADAPAEGAGAAAKDPFKEPQ